MIFRVSNPALLKIAFRVIGIFSICFAMVLIAITGYQGIQTATFVSHATATQGTIIGQKTPQNASQEVHPKVLFMNKNGKGEVFISGQLVSSTQYREGDSVRVLYDPQNPHNARIGDFYSLWRDTLGYLLGCAIFLIVGFVFYLVGTHRLPQEIPTTKRQRNGKKLVFKIASVIELLVGIGMGITSYCFYANTTAFLHHASRTQGTVTALQSFETENDSITYSPRISFKDTRGRSATFTANMSSNPPHNSVGDKVDVVYDPNNPSNAKVDKFFNLWLMPLVLCVVSVISLIFSVGLALASRFLF